MYVELPEERREPGKCAKLKKWLYGTRGAAQGWGEEYSSRLRSWGFQQGTANPCAFRHDDHDVDVTVHGDDFIILGTTAGLDWFRSRMATA